MCCPIMTCVYTFWFLCCDVHYDFYIKTMFGSFLPPLVCRRVHVLFTVFCGDFVFLFVCLFFFFAHSGVQHILCCVFVLFLLVLLTIFLDCFFFNIAPSVFSNVYYIISHIIPYYFIYIKTKCVAHLKVVVQIIIWGSRRVKIISTLMEC